LRLDLVESVEGLAVERLVLLVVEGGDGQRLEVKESGRRRELLGEDKVLEGEGKAGFGVHPAVRDDGDEVVGRERVEHGDGEGDVVILLGIALTEHELVVEEDDFAVDVLNDDPERFRATVHLLVPLEVGGDGELDAEEGAGDGLDVSLKLEFGELVDQAVDETTSLRLTNELTEFCGRGSSISA
jgi:hypothetical protein